MSSEGKHLGKGDNEPNDELFFAAIDEEWAEFNKQLDHDIDKDPRAVELTEELDAIGDDLLSSIDQHGIRRFIFQQDDQAEYTTCRSYLQELYDRCLRELSYVSEVKGDSNIDRPRYVQKALACTMAYISEKKFQEAVVTYAGYIEYVYRHHDELGTSIEELEQMKKSMQAELLVRHGRNANDMMILLFAASRSEVKGLIGEMDTEYITNAQQALPRYIQMQNDQASILETSIDLVTYKSGPELWDDVAQMSVVLANIAELYLIAAEPFDPTDGAALAKRNEQLWKYRQNVPVGIGDAEYKELIDYFDGNYNWNASDE
jgi:hypothetical protein